MGFHCNWVLAYQKKLIPFQLYKKIKKKKTSHEVELHNETNMVILRKKATGKLRRNGTTVSSLLGCPVVSVCLRCRRTGTAVGTALGICSSMKWRWRRQRSSRSWRQAGRQQRWPGGWQTAVVRCQPTGGMTGRSRWGHVPLRAFPLLGRLAFWAGLRWSA